MKRFACLLLALLMLCAAVPLRSFAAENTVTVPVEASKLYSASFQMLELLNAERTSRGLNALTMDPELLELSMQRAFETAVYWSHIRPNGVRYPSLNSRLNRENIAARGGVQEYDEYYTSDAMDSFMKSDAHRENILLPDAKSIGIGVIYVGSNLYWVQNFSRSAPIGKAAQPADGKAKMNVEVLKDLEYYAPDFNVEKADLEAGTQTNLVVRWGNALMPFENITVFSSNPNVVSVNGSTVTAHGSGTAVLSMYYGDYQAGAQDISIRVTGGTPAAPYQPKAFTDVKPGTWYADAVQWAVENSITSGTSATTFSPDNPCTRSQAVTFLWRAAGSPQAAKDNWPFWDTHPSQYYYKAVLWAAENNITSGTGDKEFSPDLPCTRAQIVTFLWRTAGSPQATGTNPFADVKLRDYYYNAVQWAAKNDITNGVSAASFAPDLTCTRAQIVTFLYRYMTGAQA